MSRRAPAAPLQGWRRRPDVRFEGTETAGAAFNGERATPRWHLWGPHAQDDLVRIMQGLICVRCFQPFPCRLNLGSRRRIMEDCKPFMRPDHQVARLIDASHCPFCAAEVSPEMADAFFEGYMERLERPAELEPGQHGSFERLIERGQDEPGEMYLPPGWDR